jgi:hypothetical protein
MASGSAQFDSVHLLPPGWESDVKAGYEVFKQNAQLFTAPTSPPQFDQLRRMVNGNNSVLATMAFRTLLENRRMDSGLVRSALTGSQGYRRAVFVYLLMRLSPSLQLDQLIDEVDQLINRITFPEEYKPVALGIATARLLHPELRSPQSAGLRLNKALRSRTGAPGGAQETDAYLRQLFEVMGPTTATPLNRK